MKPVALQTDDKPRQAVKMRANQIPVIINNATTGHKLQGSGVDSIFVHNWNYSTNWPYVVLSRVKTLDGLYLRKPLDRRLSKYAVPPALLRMLARLRQKAPTYWDEDDYEEMFGSY